MVLVQRVPPAGADGAQPPPVDVKEAYEPENVPGMPKEFYAAHRDPRLSSRCRRTAPTACSCATCSTKARAGDPRRTYRLSIAPAADRQDFRLVAWPRAAEPLAATAAAAAAPTSQVWGANLRPGGVMAVSVLAFRTGGFAGEITLSAEGLPAGVSCPPVTLNAGANGATLLLVADENAPAFVGPIRVVGKAVAGAARLTRVARAGTVVWGVTDSTSEPWRSRVAQELMLAVTSGEVEPIAVAPAEQKVWEQSVAGVIEVPLKVTRRGAYAGAVQLKPAGAAQLAAAPAFEVAAGATDAKLTLDVGALALPAGQYSVHLLASSAGAYDRYPQQLAAANAAKADADKATPELAAAAQKAKDALAAAKAATPPKPEDVAAAEQAAAAAEAAVKQNEQAKASLAEQLKALAPKEVTAYAYSPPIALKIGPAPIAFAAPAAEVTLKPGAKADVPVTITRLYGFADAVTLGAAVPQGVAGLSVTNGTVAPGAAEGTVAIQAAADAKPGDHVLTLAATATQNNRPVKLEQPLRVRVLPP
jgi:hypothetical protein